MTDRPKPTTCTASFSLIVPTAQFVGNIPGVVGSVAGVN